MNVYKPKIVTKSVLFSLFVILSCFRINAFSQEGHGGQAGSFLRNDVGVRALGLGGAFTAIANDVTAVYWNPAGLVNLYNVEIAASYALLSLDRRHNFAAVCFPSKSAGVFSFSWIRMDVGGIEGRDQIGAATGETFVNSENAFSLSYGIPLSNNLAIGASYKYLTDNLANFNATGYSLDAGCLLRVFSGLKLGLVAKDIKSKMKWDTASGREEDFPTTLRFGMATQPSSLPIILAIDYECVRHQIPTWHMGLEVALFSGIGFRLGYNDNSFSTGGFIEMPLQNNRLQFNYVLRNDPLDATWVQRFSINLKFDTKRSELRNSGFIHPNIKDIDLQLPTAKVIKIVSQYPLYAIINIGSSNEMKNGLRLKIYRYIHGNSGNLEFLGIANVIKTIENLSAIKAISVSQGFKFKDGDLLFLN